MIVLLERYSHTRRVLARWPISSPSWRTLTELYPPVGPGNAAESGCCYIIGSPVTGIAFSPEGRYLATSEIGARSILIYDLQTRAPRMSLEDGREVARTLAFSPDGARLASARRSAKHVQLWDLNTRRGFPGLHWARAFRECHRVLPGWLTPWQPPAMMGLSGSGLWRRESRRARLDGQAAWLKTFVVSPDGRTLVLGTGDDDNLRMWDLVKLLGGHQRQALR